MGQGFVIPLWADLSAVALGGLQGALFAAGFRGRQRLDLLGVALIGVLFGMGGGIIRDLLLGQTPATLRSDWYLVTATLSALVGMLVSRPLHRVEGLIVGLDAVVIGLFGAFGTSKAILVGLPMVPAVFVGVCAAVGGGVLRDVMMGLPVAVMHVGALYAVAAGAGAVVLVVLHVLGVAIPVAGVAAVAVTIVLRLVAVRFDLSLPEQQVLHRRRVAAQTGAIPVVGHKGGEGGGPASA